MEKYPASPLRMPVPEFDYESDPSDEDDEDSENYIPFADRPEWKDVTPVRQDDGPYQVVAIKYTEKFRQTFDYFRAVLANNEISDRAFKLTTGIVALIDYLCCEINCCLLSLTECIRLNPSNFTVWYYRRKLIEGLNYDYNEENDYIRKIIIKNPKNYQVWEHYKTVLVKLRAAVDVDKKPDVAEQWGKMLKCS